MNIVLKTVTEQSQQSQHELSGVIKKIYSHFIEPLQPVIYLWISQSSRLPQPF